MTFAGGRGFVTYRGRVEEALAHYRADPAITRVEWKTRSHDRALGLHDALVRNGFVPDEPESIMVGEARRLDVDVQLPDGVALRRVTAEVDVRAFTAMQEDVLGVEMADEMAEALLERLRADSAMELWVAEADGQIVSASRLEPVSGAEFAGSWGGATRPEWRRRGIYGALTAARALGAATRQAADPQRLDRVLAPDPRARRLRQALDHGLALWSVIHGYQRALDRACSSGATAPIAFWPLLAIGSRAAAYAF